MRVAEKIFKFFTFSLDKLIFIFYNETDAYDFKHISDFQICRGDFYEEI